MKMPYMVPSENINLIKTPKTQQLLLFLWPSASSIQQIFISFSLTVFFGKDVCYKYIWTSMHLYTRVLEVFRTKSFASLSFVPSASYLDPCLEIFLYRLVPVWLPQEWREKHGKFLQIKCQSSDTFKSGDYSVFSRFANMIMWKSGAASLLSLNCTADFVEPKCPKWSPPSSTIWELNSSLTTPCPRRASKPSSSQVAVSTCCMCAAGSRGAWADIVCDVFVIVFCGCHIKVHRMDKHLS